MNAVERGEKVKGAVEAIYSALDAQGLITHRGPQALTKVLISSALIDAWFAADTQIDVPSWGIGR